MPSLPSPGNVIRVNLTFTIAGSYVIGTRFFLSYSGSPPSSSGLNALCSEVGTAFAADLEALMSTAYVLSAAEATDLSSTSGQVGTAVLSVGGSRSGTTNPISSCAVVDYLIGRRYRGGKPRGYWPFGVTSDVTNDQTWTSAFRSSVNTGIGNFFAALIAYGGAGVTIQNHVNVSYYIGFTNYTGSGGRAKVRSNLKIPPGVDTVTTHAIRTTLGSQRRRLTAV